MQDVEYGLPMSVFLAEADKENVMAQRCHTFQGTANGQPLFAPVNAAQPS